MLATLKSISNQTGEIFLPPCVDAPDHHNVLAAIERHRTARIAKLAAFIFSTAATFTVTVLAEIGIIAGLWTLPALLISIASWGIFYRIHMLEDVYLENADDDIRQSLAKKHLERLLFETTLENGTNIQQLYPMFAHVNDLLGAEIFTKKVMQRLAKLDLSCADNRPLFEIALDQGFDLAFHVEKEIEEPGRFGKFPCKHKTCIQWDGNKETPLSIFRKKVSEACDESNDKASNDSQKL